MENLGDNASRQSEELEALNSIYGEEWKEDFGKGSWGITLSDGSLSLELLVTLTEVYPNQGPPILQILAPSLSRNEMKEITSVLEGIYLDNIGETVIFQWIERAREWLQDKTSSRCNEADPQLSASSVVDENFSDYLKMQSSGYNETKIKQSGNVEALSYITHGDPIDFKKSTFQGHVSEVTSAEDVKKVLSCLMENKKIANATHNMYAYRIYQEETKTFSQDCDDDGETHAGGRIMHLLQLIDARNVLVVVSRWYGGVHLGPDRFKLINNAARQVIEKAGLLPSPGKKKKH